jgi:2-dehydropantoate 2-reductase
MKANRQSKSWHFIGAGALGCLWIHQCRASGLDLTLLLRNEQRLAQFKRAGGVALVQNGGAELQTCVALTTEQAAALEPPQSVRQLILCCKAQQTAAAFAAITAAVADDATVLLVQNGMGVAEELLAARPGLRLFCGVSTDGAHLVAPFTVQRAGVGITRIGLFPAEPTLGSSRTLCSQLGVPGLTLEPCANIKLAQWQKLAVNAVINPLTALYDVSNGALLTSAEPSALIAPLCIEIARVAAAEGLTLDADSISQDVYRVCQLTSANISSMLQDTRQGRDTELDYINGYLQRRAAEHRIEMPLNLQLIDRLKAQRPTPIAAPRA